jgi:hypothetical protein
MAAEDDLRNTIIRVLNSPNTLRIHYIYRDTLVNGTGFQQIDRLLKQKSISIEIDARIVNSGAEAGYHAPTDTFIFPRANYGSTLEEQSEIVHECVHALYDYQIHSYLFEKAEAEAPAYLGGALYLTYARGPYFTPPYGNGPGKLKRKALDIARTIYLSPSATVISQRDITDLEQLASSAELHPFYSHYPYYDGIDPVRAKQRRQAGKP